MGREPAADPIASRADLLWGERRRPPRGRRPALSLELIVRTAIAIADTAGMPALSMQRLAAELGAGTMSLYRYVPGKAELAALMLDTAIGAPPEHPDSRDWRAGLERWARENHAIFNRHPWALPLVTEDRLLGPNETAHLEAALRTISGCGLGAREMLDVVLLVNGFVRGTARHPTAAAAADAVTSQLGGATVDAIESHGRGAQYPTLVNALAELRAHRPATDPRAGFEFGLQRILDGLERYVGNRAG